MKLSSDNILIDSGAVGWFPKLNYLSMNTVKRTGGGSFCTPEMRRSKSIGRTFVNCLGYIPGFGSLVGLFRICSNGLALRQLNNMRSLDLKSHSEEKKACKALIGRGIAELCGASLLLPIVDGVGTVVRRHLEQHPPKGAT